MHQLDGQMPGTGSDAQQTSSQVTQKECCDVAQVQCTNMQSAALDAHVARVDAALSSKSGMSHSGCAHLASLTFAILLW